MSEATSTAANDTVSSTSPDAWIRTRICYCDANAATDCRFHSSEEKGWEICPNTKQAEQGLKLGRWLWARNPEFGRISAAADESLLEEAA